MIDWDEILEDINWKKFAGLLILGIAVIVIAVLIGIDWHNSNTLKVLLENDLTQVDNFRKSWAEYNTKEITELEAQATELEGQVQASGISVPLAIDGADLENRIKTAANQSGVTLERLNSLPAKVDGYAKIQPIQVVFTAGSVGAAKSFLAKLQQIEVPHTFSSDAVRLSGTLTINLDFYCFDEAAFNEITDCNVKLTIPTIMPRELSGIYLFGFRVKDLKAKVDQESASLVDVKRKFTSTCDAQNKVDKLSSMLEIIKTVSTPPAQ